MHLTVCMVGRQFCFNFMHVTYLSYRKQRYSLKACINYGSLPSKPATLILHLLSVVQTPWTLPERLAKLSAVQMAWTLPERWTNLRGLNHAESNKRIQTFFTKISMIQLLIGQIYLNVTWPHVVHFTP